MHLLILGVATSAPLVGKTAARWRNKFFWLGFFLLVADLCVVSFYNPYEKGVLNTSLIPWSLHTRLYTLRMLMLTTCDALCAGLIYLSATNRFIFGPTPSLPADEQVDQFANMAASDITNATNKIHALGLVRNAITHDPVLRKREDVACRELARDTGWMVGEDGRTILDDDGVSQAISSALAKRAQEKGDHGSSEVDVTKLVMAEVTKFVEGVTASLELQR